MHLPLPEIGGAPSIAPIHGLLLHLQSLLTHLRLRPSPELAAAATPPVVSPTRRRHRTAWANPGLLYWTTATTTCQRSHT